MRNWLTLIAIVPLLFGCGSPVRKEALTGHYVLFAADRPEDLSICYLQDNSCIGGIPGTIQNVGWDDHYISAQQMSGGKTAFYFIDMDAPDAAMSGVNGPLSKAEFDNKRAELGLPPLSHKISDSYSLERAD